jgi:uncharacterized membrane protein
MMFNIPLHELIIHFPIALTIIAAVYDSWGVYSRRPQMHETAYGLTLWAAVSALVAVVSGLDLAGGVFANIGALTGHGGFGIAAAIVITERGILRYSARARDQTGYRIVGLALAWGATALIAGATLSGESIGPR